MVMPNPPNLLLNVVEPENQLESDLLKAFAQTIYMIQGHSYPNVRISVIKVEGGCGFNIAVAPEISHDIEELEKLKKEIKND